MLESGGGGDFSAAMVNSILLALWAALPALAVAYARQRALAPRRAAGRNSCCKNPKGPNSSVLLSCMG